MLIFIQEISLQLFLWLLQLTVRLDNIADVLAILCVEL